MFRKTLLISGILFWCCGSIFGQQETNTFPAGIKQGLPDNKEGSAKKWALSLEAGSGNILGLTFARQKLAGLLDIGIGGGFNTSNELVGEETYFMLFLNGNISGTFHIIDKNNFDVSARLEFGYDSLSVGGKFSSYTFDLTPALLAGYKNFYAALSGVYLLSKESVFVPQIGVGYKFQF